MLFRLGGDEFAILLETVGDPSDALRVAKNIQTAIADPFVIESREVRISLSIGIALSTPEACASRGRIKGRRQRHASGQGARRITLRSLRRSHAHARRRPFAAWV